LERHEQVARAGSLDERKPFLRAQLHGVGEAAVPIEQSAAVGRRRAKGRDPVDVTVPIVQ